METSILNLELKKNKINPKTYLKRYIKLIEKDCKKILKPKLLKKSHCPTNKEKSCSSSFKVFGMKYNVSKTYKNIYLEKKPDEALLRKFYLNSKARKFWKNKIWPTTKNERNKKIIYPLVEWIERFIDNKKKVIFYEFFSNHTNFSQGIRKKFKRSKYVFLNSLIENSKKYRNYDPNFKKKDKKIAVLFESINRCVEPEKLMKNVKIKLESGDLCFITTLLASGFEIKILGKSSKTFIPPERMNILSLEGLQSLIKKVGGFEILELSTPAILDIPNVIEKMDKKNEFFNYIFNQRKDSQLIENYRQFLQLFRLGTYCRMVLKRK
tara:strand:- start:2252 stop:3223 length:972 start_codon:yes stop_codon:yes gene_type:complete